MNTAEFEKRSAARRKALAKMSPERLREIALKSAETRRRRGHDRPPPEKREERRQRYVATLRRNRAAALAALSPEERRAAVIRRHERFAAAARRGWQTRRRNAGLRPGPAEPTTLVRVYARDTEWLRAMFGPDVKMSLRTALEGLQLVMGFRWTGDGWTLGGEAAHGPQEPR